MKIHQRGRGKYKPAQDYSLDEVRDFLHRTIEKEIEKIKHVSNRPIHFETPNNKFVVVSLFSGCGGLDLGFELASESDRIAYFKSCNSSFLLQDFFVEEHAKNFMMHLLVENIEQFYSKLKSSGIEEKYRISKLSICSISYRGPKWSLPGRIAT